MSGASVGSIATGRGTPVHAAIKVVPSLSI